MYYLKEKDCEGSKIGRGASNRDFTVVNGVVLCLVQGRSIFLKTLGVLFRCSLSRFHSAEHDGDF